ncbi:MAG TPA: hypothetical protein PK698_06490 [Bacilli bacterium]|nr:hypothetical protein [Bacilli bacterium]
MKCGDANIGGNIKLVYKGGCYKNLELKDAYRCAGCGGWFHKDCIMKHFELEKEHDVGRNDLRQKVIILIKDFFNKNTFAITPESGKNLVKKIKKL